MNTESHLYTNFYFTFPVLLRNTLLFSLSLFPSNCSNSVNILTELPAGAFIPRGTPQLQSTSLCASLDHFC